MSHNGFVFSASEDEEVNIVIDEETTKPEPKVTKTPVKRPAPAKGKDKESPSQDMPMGVSTIERFNTDAAYKLIEYKDLFKGKIRAELFEDEEYDCFKMLENYVNNSKNGKIKVTYKQANGRGRFFAEHGCSLQSLCREIRGTIAGDLYYDIDMVNCHPMIFKKLCDDSGLSTTYLTSLCYDREKVIGELLNIIPGSNKDGVKQGLLAIINGGIKFYDSVKQLCVDNKYDWLSGFYKEVRKNICELCKLNTALFEEVKQSGKKRPKSSTVNILFCVAENMLLQIMVDYFRSAKIISEKNNYVNCFDGIMVERKKCKSLEKLQAHIIKIEKLFLDAGYNMKLKIKDFEKIDLNIDPEDMAKCDALKKPAACEIPNTFNYKDPYSFVDFHNEFARREFSSYGEMKMLVGEAFPKVIAKVLTGDGIYIKKTSTGVDITRKLGLSDFKMYFPTSKGYSVTTLSDFLASYKSFGEFVCKLNNENTPDKSFNIWKGFQAERVNLNKISDEVKEGLELMKTFVMEVWASGNEHYYNYIISWFAGLVANLDGINRVALAMVSKEGCGKGTFTDFMRYILGTDAVAEIVGIQAVTQKHNTVIQNKRLVLVNEMSSTKEEFRSNFDKIKSFITDEWITIEPKGVSPYKIDNIGNYILCTNHADSIIISESDRRYAVFEASEVHMNDWSYFENLRKKCFNQDVANAFYTYLLDFEAISLGIIPKTEIRQQLQELSLPSPLKFVNHIIEEQIYEDGEKVAGSVLYSKYTRWCSENGERVVTNTKFGTVIKSKWNKSRSSDGVKYTIEY